ncbi:MAG: dihydrofolate reductase family protein [Candidatus Cohnella colombiensis]|uniref:Dihydrofolate reductase family protein n=1 Tax=Candidatus Cohnella colombiensis TaxID=3121368 RepID=A0AA95EX80_9BACL|nr:MAG: dihydrofolate reductase family protein [Cohnella sp.]
MTKEIVIQEEGHALRKIVAGLFISLDGVVDSPENSPHRWTSDEMMDRMANGIAQADTVLVGSSTYSLLAQFWQYESDTEPMARFLNHSHKYVVSRSMHELEWQPASLITGDLVQELTRLKQQPGKNIQIPGSPRLVRLLLREGLLDEFTLHICPVVVGSGMRLFDEINAPLKLTLVDSTLYRNGVLGVTYRTSRN